MFSTVEFKKNYAICNYGGIFLSEEYTKAFLLMKKNATIY